MLNITNVKICEALEELPKVQQPRHANIIRYLYTVLYSLTLLDHAFNFKYLI